VVTPGFIDATEMSVEVSTRRVKLGGMTQARNHLGTPGVAKSFLRGAEIF